MGFGDAVMATALVRGLHAQGRRAAFFSPDGDHRTIKWTGYCEEVFAHNPNIARPGAQGDNLVWMPHYKKTLPYCHYDGHRCCYVWNYHFKATPGEFYFAADERQSLPVPKPFIVIEPNVAWQRRSTINKDWGNGKYEALARLLIASGYTVVQCIHAGSRRTLDVHQVLTEHFRKAVRVMSQASLIIAPEGGNHHVAAALGIPAVILWGAWSPVETMGYADQANMTGGETYICGQTHPCSHCRATFERISVDEVYQAALQKLH